MRVRLTCHVCRARGKLLLVHGTADAIIPTDASLIYYRRVQAAMGEQAAEGTFNICSFW